MESKTNILSAEGRKQASKAIDALAQLSGQLDNLFDIPNDGTSLPWEAQQATIELGDAIQSLREILNSVSK